MRQSVPITLTTKSLSSSPTIPPFPENVPTAPLVCLSLAKLRTDKAESDRFFNASKDFGFFYLDLRGDNQGEQLLSEADQLFEVGKELYDLGRQELVNYEYKHQGSFFGYKGFGKPIPEEKGRLDWNEFYNAPKDDFLGISKKPFAHPPVLNNNGPLLSSYMRNAHSIVTLMLLHLNNHLELPPATLIDLHRQYAVSGDHVRFIKSPPQPRDNLGTSMGAHTDFGSMTILFNRVGGLQVLPPGENANWCYVKPLSGHCIVNLGDAMVKFTNGLLRSNIHRVTAPPGDQVSCTRYSLVYFVRPEDQVKLKRLEGSSIIPPLADGVVERDICSVDWIKEKVTQQRTGVYRLDSGERIHLSSP